MNVKTVSPASTQIYANSGTQAVLENITDVKTIPLQTVEVQLETEVVSSEVLKSAKERAFELAGDAVRYDPVVIAAQYRNRPIQVWGRMLSVFWTFFGFTFSLWFDGASPRTKNVAPPDSETFLPNSAQLSSKSDKHSQPGPT